jgi:proteasome accessory factor B
VDKLERLLNLTLTLLETPRPLTASEIRERVPGYPDGLAAFRRSFERDKESLREMGIPLTITEISHSDPPADGYRILADEYYLQDPGLDPDELAAVHLAASAVRLDTTHGIEGLWKLGGAGLDPASNPAPAPDPTLAELPGDPNLGPIFGAVADRAHVQFTYNGRARTVDPYRLDYRRGHWYLTAFDRDHGEERNFRIDRIEDDVRPGAAGGFERPDAAAPGGPAQPWQFGEGDTTTARLLVDRDQAPWVRGHLGADAVVEERSDGALVFEVAVTNWPAFRSFVLTFLDHAELLDPPELRSALLGWLDQVIAS